MKFNIKIELPQETFLPQFEQLKRVTLKELFGDNGAKIVGKPEVEQVFRQSPNPLVRSCLVKLLVYWHKIESFLQPTQQDSTYQQWSSFFAQLPTQPAFLKQLFVRPLEQLWTSNELEVQLPLPAPFNLSLPQLANQYQFHGLKTTSNLYQLKLANQSMTIALPGAFDSKFGQLLGIEELVRVLAALPLQILRLINSVLLNPIPDPDDANLSQQGYESHHRALMSMLDRQVTIYPSGQNKANLAQDIYRALFHEAGHQIEDLEALEKPSYQKWREEWSKAIAEDGNFYPTGYAEKSHDLSEDFAESFGLYFLSRSTPIQQEYTLLFPHRMRFIKEKYDS